MKDAREKHVEAALEDMVRLVERPLIKSDYIKLFNESLLIQSRSSFQALDSDCQWRHGWLYDSCADQEPQVTEKKSVMTTSPQPDGPVAKMFYEAALTLATENDVLIGPNARSAGASKLLAQGVAKAAVHEVVNIIYKEYPLKGKQKLHEVVHVAMTKTSGYQPVRPRLYYQLTTTASDVIIQAEDMDCPQFLEQQEKMGILGHLQPSEKMLKPTDKVMLYHWEKHEKLYEELLHHFQLSSLTTASCGRLPLLKACVRRGVRCLALYRNKAHGDVLRRDMIAWMYEESLTNPDSGYYLKRQDLIEQLGLDPDAAVSQAGGLDAASSDGEPPVEPKEDAEAKEGAEEDPEEEPKAEDPEVDPEPEADPCIVPPNEDKPKPKGKAVGNPKAKPMGKAVAKPKAKPKGKAAGKPKPKAKPKGKKRKAEGNADE